MGYRVGLNSVRYEGYKESGFRNGDCDKLLKWDLERARADVKKMYNRGVACLCAQSVLVDFLFHYEGYRREEILDRMKDLQSYTDYRLWTNLANWFKHHSDLSQKDERRMQRNVDLIKRCN